MLCWLLVFFFFLNNPHVLGLKVEIEEPVTVKTYMFPKAQPTRDSTKVFTHKVETSTAKARLLPKNPARTEVQYTYLLLYTYSWCLKQRVLLKPIANMEMVC